MTRRAQPEVPKSISDDHGSTGQKEQYPGIASVQ
ncbi:hypothetical protein OROGR_005892 [Orobanche gracilis]